MEKTRITYILSSINLLYRKAGGGFFFNRVGGVLAVSRAIGDHVLRDQGVIANPFINKLELRLIHKWIIVASDGLWDVMTENVNNLMNSFLKDVL